MFVLFKKNGTGNRDLLVTRTTNELIVLRVFSVCRWFICHNNILCSMHTTGLVILNSYKFFFTFEFFFNQRTLIFFSVLYCYNAGRYHENDRLHIPIRLLR